MATRKIKDAKDLSTNELIYFKGHAKATYMSDGRNVEEAIHQIGTGGSGGITAETDPIFSASAAASITEEKKAEWDNKVDKVSGKQLTTEDFTSALKTKLEGLSNYDDTELSNALSTLRSDFDKLVSGDTTTAIKTFNEVIAFLDGIQDTQDLSSIIASIEQQIADKQATISDLATIRSGAALGATAVQPSSLSQVATSGSYNDLSDKPTIPDVSNKVDKVSGKGLSTNDYTTTEKNKLAGIAAGAEVNVQSDWNVTDSSSDAYIKNKPTIPSAVTESTVSGWGFTKNTGTYSKPSGGIPKGDLASAVQTSLGKADTALQSYTEQYKGTVTGVKINGTTKSPSSGVVDLGTVITAHQTLKTINGESIIGSGNITIEGGGGDDIRYFTEFTVSEFISACNNETSITSEGFFDAIMSNKIICVPYYNGSEGFLIASSSYMYQDTTEHHEFTCEIVYGLRQYTAMMSTSDLTYFNDTLAGLFPEENARQVIILDSPIIEYNDNVTYVIKEEVDELLIMYWGYKGSTISFNTGNNPTLVFYRLVVWANGVMPEIEPNTHYELSLVGTYDDSIAAVLTPFKPVE